MNLSKKLLVILLSIFVLFALSGCSKSGKTETAGAAKEAPSEAAGVQAKAGKPEQPAQAAAQKAEASGGAEGDKIKVQLFVMSDCPFGKTAENIIIKTIRALKDYVDFELRFVVGEQGGQLRSLHGQKEIDKNAVQICAGKVAPDKQLEFVVEWNKTPTESWRTIAANLGLDADAIQNCIDSGYGIEVLKGDAKLCEKLGVRASPTLLIDGKKYDGPRSSKHYFKAFCKALKAKGVNPEVCDNPPDYLSYSDGHATSGSCGGEKGGQVFVDENPYNLVIVYPEDAIWPLDANLQRVLEQIFPEAKIERVSDKSERGKKLLQKAGLDRLPAVVTTDQKFAKSPLAENNMLKIECRGGVCFISPDSYGANFFAGLKPRKDTFEIYYRPDSERARNIIPQIIAILKGNNYQAKKTKIALKPYLMIMDGDLATQSGVEAIDEAKREAVIASLWPNALGTYLGMLNSDFSNWQTAAKRAGIPADELGKKVDSGEAEDLLRENAKQIQPFAVGPRSDIAFLYNGQELVMVRNAQEFDQLIKKLP